MTSSIASIKNSIFPAFAAFFFSLNATLAADETFIIDHYTDEHGLPQNSIKGIGQDNLGFLWLISEKGPIRYDGNGQFRTFDNLSASLRTDRMMALYQGGPGGELWAQAENDTLVMLKDGQAVTSADTFWDVFEKPGPALAETLVTTTRLPAPYPEALPECLFIPDGTGSGFVVSKDSISFTPHHQKTAHRCYFPNKNPWGFVGFQGKLLYLNQLRSCVVFHRDNRITQEEIGGDLLSLPANTHFTIYWNTASNQLFVYAEKKLYRLTEDGNGGFSSTLLVSGLDFKKNAITTAHYMPSQGKLFLGSATKGLFVVQKRHFNTLHSGVDYPNNTFYNQTLLPNGLLLTNEGRAFDRKGQPHLLPFLQEKKHQYHQVIGPDGNLWIFQWDTILLVSPQLNQLIGIRQNPALAKFSDWDENSNFWIGGDAGILQKYQADRDSFLTMGSFPAITYIEDRGLQELYVGTENGLFVFNTLHCTKKEIPEFAGKTIRSIYKESASRHWITTYQQGFFLCENGEVTAFPLDKNGYLATSHCMLEDARGFLWISTNKGLFKVNKQQLLAYKKDQTKVPFYFYYDKRWGFNTNEFNGGCKPCAIKLPDGNFSFPSLDGLVQFTPDAINDHFPSGDIILDGVILDKKNLPTQDTICIPQDFSRLDIKIATPFYGSPHNMEIEYIVTSEDKPKGNWLPLNGADNTLSINELSSGSHDILVRMRKGMDARDFNYATFHLYIQPLFHETTWFTLLLCTILGLAIWLIIALRTRFILNQNRLLVHKVNERTHILKSQYEWQQRLSTSITHDIKAPLNYVVKALGNIQDIAKAEGFLPREMEQIYLSIKNIYHYSNNLTKLAKLMLTSDVLEFTDVPLYQVAQRQIDIFKSAAESRGNTVHNHVPIGTIVHSNADVLAVIIHNLLDNATKFTQNGEIEIDVAYRADMTILFSISDTGVGLYPEQIHYYNEMNKEKLPARTDEKSIGFGLLLVKDMARFINAEMSLHSVLGGGTTVSFILHMVHAKSVD
ncbi:sensor histidine kinase [Parapedobacter indicus]|uniref:Signal transduction histidine kinase n=1 Tax=Parapedobacter indicus TaxID=1477437 RepID=A0A1I3CN82_9SPHI|nr:ATP-binding protein [Parapedobacter indicus]PPL04314.1 signal transduction histidine kinase [Parapedobacter indicus]SFH75681.1 Signal transduction histidine kinase [Parapedobacter indicus]